MSKAASNYDESWKEMCDTSFQRVLELSCPDLVKDIDWTQPVQFSDTKLPTVAPAAKVGRQHVDHLAQVLWKRSQEPVLIHTEVQLQFERSQYGAGWGYRTPVTELVTGGLAGCWSRQDWSPSGPDSWGLPLNAHHAPRNDPFLRELNPETSMDPAEMSLETARFYQEEAKRLLAEIRSESTHEGKVRLLRDMNHVKSRMDYEIRLIERMLEADGDDDQAPDALG
jgi:hypothetical protein